MLLLDVGKTPRSQQIIEEPRGEGTRSSVCVGDAPRTGIAANKTVCEGRESVAVFLDNASGIHFGSEFQTKLEQVVPCGGGGPCRHGVE